MKRLLVLALCLLVAAACSKKASDPAGVASDAKPAAAAPAAPAAEPAAAPAAENSEPKKVEITEDLVQKYIDYQKEQFALVAKYAEDAKKNLAAAKGDAAKSMETIQVNERLANEMEDKLKARRAALGFTDEQFEAVKDAADTIATGRMAFTQMGGDAQIAKMEAEAKVQIAKLPADQRAAAEADAAKTLQAFKDTRDGADVRKKYGDKSADAILKYADVLAKMQFEALKAAAGK